MTGELVVRAAGGVVWRRGPTTATVEVALVRRAKYGDWSLPKGKLDPGESWRQAAVREVTEETGLTVRLGRYLCEVSYPDRQGAATKVVRFWAMQALAGRFVPHAEIDALRWLPLAAAGPAFTHARDRAVLVTFRSTR